MTTEAERREALRREMLQFQMDAARPSDAAPETPPNSPTNTGVVGQALSGFNEGLADLAGLPVDAATGLINAMDQRGQDMRVASIDPATGRPSIEVSPEAATPAIVNPVGGSASNRRLMGPFTANDAPDTTGERYARRIGQDLGASAIPIGAAAATSARVPALLATELASSVSSGAAGQAAEDAGAGPVLQAAASVLGGGAPVLGSAATRPRAQGVRPEEIEARRDAGYAEVEASTATVPETMRDALLERLRGGLGNDLDDVLHPRASRALTRAEALPEQPSISDIDRLRRFLRNNVAGSSETSEAALGQQMVRDIDGFLQDAAASGQLGDDGQRIVDRLLQARSDARRMHALDTIQGETGAFTRATRRAATTGTGGNATNAIRQNIRAILDQPSRRRGFVPEEIDAMERVVEGTPAENRLRLLSTISPDRGGLPMMGALGGIGMGTAMNNNALLGITLGAGVAGLGANRLAQGMTNANISRVIETILNGQPLPSRALSLEERQVLATLLATNAAQTGGDTSAAHPPGQ